MGICMFTLFAVCPSYHYYLLLDRHLSPQIHPSPCFDNGNGNRPIVLIIFVSLPVNITGPPKHPPLTVICCRRHNSLSLLPSHRWYSFAAHLSRRCSQSCTAGIVGIYDILLPHCVVHLSLRRTLSHFHHCVTAAVLTWIALRAYIQLTL